MGLIIDRKIRALMTGYPTVSDKYNVKGGILAANSTDVDANFGDVLIYGSQPGYYKPCGATGVTASTVAGILLGTNVKISGSYPDSSEGAVTKVGEAFNLLLDGFVAVELDSTAVAANVVEGAQVYLTQAGKFTTVPTTTTGTNFAYRNAVFTGIYENHGTSASPKYVAEIWVK